MLKISNLSVEYKGNLALENISLHIPKGSCTGVIGPNGAGKSTLMKSILAAMSMKLDGADFSQQ